jgi:ammonia channel protein AmtB
VIFIGLSISRACDSIFGLEAFSGVGTVSLLVQFIGTLIVVVYSFIGGFIVYGFVHFTVGFRLSRHEELSGCDIAIHRVEATSEKDHFYDDFEIPPHTRPATA